MNKNQLAKIKSFAQSFYKKTGKYHGWDHILLVKKWSLLLAKKYPETNISLLTAAVYLHDIGRTLTDHGHAQKSSELAQPFLKKLKLTDKEISTILESVSHHEKEKILQSKLIESKILFDADKLQILTVFGFMRCSFWLVEERNMQPIDAMALLIKYTEEVINTHLYTETAKIICKRELPKIKKLFNQYANWERNSNSEVLDNPNIMKLIQMGPKEVKQGKLIDGKDIRP